MHRDYHSKVEEELFRQLVQEERWTEAFDMLAAPLHEWLYQKQQFGALDDRTTLEQLILSFDYVQAQVGQGGFIQLIQNGYIRLLLTVIESLQALSLAPQMIPVLDDVLKVFVLNKDVLDKEASVTQFARLYEEFTEFEGLEERFNRVRPILIGEIVKLVASIN